MNEKIASKLQVWGEADPLVDFLSEFFHGACGGDTGVVSVRDGDDGLYVAQAREVMRIKHPHLMPGKYDVLYHVATRGAHTDGQVLALSADHPDVTLFRVWHYSVLPEDAAEPQIIDGGLMYARAGLRLPAGTGKDADVAGNVLTPERISHHCLGHFHPSEFAPGLANQEDNGHKAQGLNP